MQKPEWEQIKRIAYEEDGALRDIRIFGTNESDWEKWINFVRENYRCAFFLQSDLNNRDLIDFQRVLDFWDTPDAECIQLSIYIRDMIINTFFFDSSEISSDLCPKEVQSLEDHEAVLQYMEALSILLNKEVLLCYETCSFTPEHVYIRVFNKNIHYGF